MGRDIGGQIRVDFDMDGTTDRAGWFTIGEIHSLRRGELLDFVLGLVVEAA